MEISPAFQCYPKDWLAVTQGFTGQAFEIVVKTVWFFWLSENQPKLENDDEMIAFTLGVDVENWQKVKRIALKKGVFVETQDGFLTCPILIKEYDKQAQRRSANALNGKKGGRPRKEENPEKANGFLEKAKKSLSSSSPSSSSTPVDHSPTPQVENSGLGEREISCEFQKKAHEYSLKHAANSNMQNVNWVPGYLSIQFPQLQTEEKTPEVLLQCWQDASDATVGANGGISYLKKTFNDMVNRWKPNQKVVNINSKQDISTVTVPMSQSVHRPHIDRLLEHKEIELIFPDLHYEKQEYSKFSYKREELTKLDHQYLIVPATGEKLYAGNFKAVKHANKA
jgi:hypothetical protein